MTIDAITPGARVLCAVSGGVDSIYLLHRMTELAAQRGFTVGCAHFNHGLRGAESDRDEAFVRTQCAHLGVPFYAGRGDVASVRGMGTLWTISSRDANLFSRSSSRCRSSNTYRYRSRS